MMQMFATTRVAKASARASPSGLPAFGFLPFGAFVDVDDKKLFKSEKVKQNSVMIAGVTANFATALAVLILLLVFVFAFPGPEFPAWAKWTARFLALTFALNIVAILIRARVRKKLRALG